MIKTLYGFRDNPENPKNVQIPFFVLIGMEMVLRNIQTASLSPDEKAAHALLLNEITEKKGKITNRQAYKQAMLAETDEEKRAALNAYHVNKQFHEKKTAKGKEEAAAIYKSMYYK